MPLLQIQLPVESPGSEPEQLSVPLAYVVILSRRFIPLNAFWTHLQCSYSLRWFFELLNCMLITLATKILDSSFRGWSDGFVLLVGVPVDTFSLEYRAGAYDLLPALDHPLCLSFASL